MNVTQAFLTEHWKANWKIAAEDYIELQRLADKLIETDGHSFECQFSGCTCSRTEDYKAARTEYLRYRRS